MLTWVRPPDPAYQGGAGRRLGAWSYQCGTGRALLCPLPLPIVLPQLETQLPELGGRRAEQPDFSSVFEIVLLCVGHFLTVELIINAQLRFNSAPPNRSLCSPVLSGGRRALPRPFSLPGGGDPKKAFGEGPELGQGLEPRRCPALRDLSKGPVLSEVLQLQKRLLGEVNSKVKQYLAHRKHHPAVLIARILIPRHLPSGRCRGRLGRGRDWGMAI